MKVIGFVGSPRKEGNSALLFKEFRKLAENEGIDFRSAISSFQKKIIPCAHCDGCLGNSLCCVKDKMFEDIKLFSECEGLVLFTPIYFFQFPAQTMAFLSRLRGVKNWKEKFIILVVVSGSKSDLDSGFDLVLESMKRSCSWTGSKFLGYYHKVTYDYILDINDVDKENIISLITKMKEWKNEIKEKRN